MNREEMERTIEVAEAALGKRIGRVIVEWSLENRALGTDMIINTIISALANSAGKSVAAIVASKIGQYNSEQLLAINMYVVRETIKSHLGMISNRDSRVVHMDGNLLEKVVACDRAYEAAGGN